MGGYYGSPATILKNNKDLLGNRKRANKNDYIGIKNIPTEDHIKASPELLAALRKKYSRQRRNNSIIPIILTVLFFALLYTFFIFN